MSIFGNDYQGYSDDAIQAAEQSYSQAAGYMQPYTQNAGTDFSNGRNWLYSALGGRTNAYNQNMLNYLNMSPSQMMTQAMSGYSMSPLAQEEMAVTNSAVNNSAAAAGMAGSGTEMAAAGEIGNSIANQDIDNYLNQLLSAFGIQAKITGAYDKETQNLMDMFQDMLGVENKASSSMANNSMKEGQIISNDYNREANDSIRSNENHFRALNDLIGDVLKGGAIAMNSKGGKDSSGGSSDALKWLGMAAFL